MSRPPNLHTPSRLNNLWAGLRVRLQCGQNPPRIYSRGLRLVVCLFFFARSGKTGFLRGWQLLWESVAVVQSACTRANTAVSVCECVNTESVCSLNFKKPLLDRLRVEVESKPESPGVHKDAGTFQLTHRKSFYQEQHRYAQKQHNTLIWHVTQSLWLCSGERVNKDPDFFGEVDHLSSYK